jgi:alcohol dehydrogenase
MAAAGTLDLSPLEHRRFPLERVNEAIGALESGGFSNFVVIP